MQKISFIEDKNFLSKKSINFIETVVLGNNFPFFLNTNAVSGDNNNFMSHIVLKRIEERKNKNEINSSFYINFIDILNEFTKKNNITYKEVFRISVNFSYNNNSKCSPIHVDHEFSHRQLLVYLNTVEDAFTVIYNKSKNKILKKINPEKYKGVCFNSFPHVGFFPKKGERIVIVYTFK
tara:strand:- start:54 stop:590 length:537 start_codon:yes stop_codon:yes gene_type:complete